MEFQDIVDTGLDGPVQSTALDSEIPGDHQGASTAPSQKSQSPSGSPSKSVAKDDSIDGDNMDLDFEEISEDELDEESKVKGVGDALGVDWASLVAESRPRAKPMSSAKLRWEPHNVLVQLGVSVRFAGESLVTDVLKQHAEAQLKQQAQEEVPIKTEAATNGVKLEPGVLVKNETVDVEDVAVSHPVAAIQVAIQTAEQIRRTLFTSVGPHRRALSARRDLMIRRHLCNLPINDTYVEPPKPHDPELFKLACQLFEQYA